MLRSDIVEILVADDDSPTWFVRNIDTGQSGYVPAPHFDVLADDEEIPHLAWRLHRGRTMIPDHQVELDATPRPFKRPRIETSPDRDLQEALAASMQQEPPMEHGGGDDGATRKRKRDEPMSMASVDRVGDEYYIHNAHYVATQQRQLEQGVVEGSSGSSGAHYQPYTYPEEQQEYD